jgi:AbrB family looped-hinge helix DNA binding protein
MGWIRGWEDSWYADAMLVTIDAAGRLVIPKALRDEAGIRPGSPLEVRYRDGRIEIEVAPLEVALVEEGNVVVARARGKVPDMPASVADTVRDRLRDRS